MIGCQVRNQVLSVCLVTYTIINTTRLSVSDGSGRGQSGHAQGWRCTKRVVDGLTLHGQQTTWIGNCVSDNQCGLDWGCSSRPKCYMCCNHAFLFPYRTRLAYIGHEHLLPDWLLICSEHSEIAVVLGYNATRTTATLWSPFNSKLPIFSNMPHIHITQLHWWLSGPTQTAGQHQWSFWWPLLLRLCVPNLSVCIYQYVDVPNTLYWWQEHKGTFSATASIDWLDMWVVRWHKWAFAWMASNSIIGLITDYEVTVFDYGLEFGK